MESGDQDEVVGVSHLKVGLGDVEVLLNFENRVSIDAGEGMMDS